MSTSKTPDRTFSNALLSRLIWLCGNPAFKHAPLSSHFAMTTQIASSLTVCVEVDLGPGAHDERDGVGPEAEHEHHDHHVLHRDLGEPRDAWEYEIR